MKKEYIYRIYKDCNNEIHCQRFPIIYSNDDYIYCKEAGQKELTKIETYRVHKTYSNNVEFGYFNSEPPEHIKNQFPGKEIVCRVESLKVGIRQHQYEIDYHTQRINEHKQKMAEKTAVLNSLLEELQSKGINLN